MTWPFGDLVELGYSAGIIDPPWRLEMRSAKGLARSPERHYPCMSMDDLARLPVSRLFRGRALVLVWVTPPLLPQCLSVIAAWHLRYITMGCWAKQSRTGAKWAFGTGYWLRSAAEPFVLCSTGGASPLSARERNLIVAPIREHSRKPDEQYDLVERLAAGPYVELFSRLDRPNWASWGYDAGAFNGRASTRPEPREYFGDPELPLPEMPNRCRGA